MVDIRFSCENREHKEANACPDHPCWCWLKTHTYELSNEVIGVILTVTLEAGPREATIKDIEVQVSKDGINYEKVKTLKVSCKKKITFICPEIFRKRFRFLRFYSPDGYVDYSSGTLKCEEVCKEGETKCVNTDLYKCINGVWQKIEENSPQCQPPPPPECTEGETKCVGYDLYKCINGRWELIETYSSQCFPKMPKEYILYGLIGVGVLLILAYIATRR